MTRTVRGGLLLALLALLVLGLSADHVKAGLLTEYGRPDACEGSSAASYMLDTDCFQGFSTSNYHRISCTGTLGQARNYVWPSSRCVSLC